MPSEEDRFRFLFQRAPVGVVFLSLDGELTAANPAACKLAGRSESELLGSLGLDLVHPDDREAFRTRMVELLQGKVDDLRLEQRLVRPDGSVVWAESMSQVVTDEDGSPRYLQAVLVDVSEGRQAAIVASSTDAIVGRDLDGTITSWNAGAEHMIGFAAAEAIGQELRSILPPSRAGETQDLIARVRRGERVENLETERVRKDGVTIDVSITMSPIRDADGALVGTSTVARDITTSKRALEGLQALEARRSAIMESALDCIITMDHHGRVVEFNPSAERTFGFARADILGKRMADLIIPPSLRGRHSQGLAHYLATGDGPMLGQRMELVAQRSDGSEFPVELAVTRVDLPGEPLFTGYLRDLTEQKRIQSELAESEQLLQAMLDNSSALIAITDMEGRYQFINRALAETVGMDRDGALGRTVDDLFPAAMARRVWGRNQEVARTGQPVQYEIVAPLPGGDRSFQSSTFPVFDATGSIYAIASIATDVTQTKAAEAERELLGERRRQAERLESLGELAGGVAHDFNNLLGVIMNYAAFVADATADDPRISADVEQIRAAAERAARLTRQLLIVGRREAIRTEVLALDAIVADLRDLLARSIGEHIDLVVESASDLPPVRADRGQIEQLLLNLTVNARDAMPDGGTVTITTTAVDVDDAYRQLHPDADLGRHVELAVSDTGIGMAPEVAAHAFEPFFTTKPKGQGTGLGLATVYGIVTEAGGSVSVYSEPGIGTTFRILLRAVDEPLAAPPTPTADVLEGHGETILVVEDEPAIMETTARILRQHGYDVIEAATGALALEVLGDRPIDLLLTDSVMPQMSGRELVQRVADLLPDLPVLFMSGYSEGVVGPPRAASEDAPLLQKPFTVEALLRYVHATLAGATP